MEDTENNVLSDDFISDIEHVEGSDSPVLVDADDIEEDEIDISWYSELEEVLSEDFVDQGIIKSVCKCRNIPAKYRPEVWKICLNVASRSDSMSSWDGKLDLSNHDELKEDCTKVVDKILDEHPELEIEGFDKTKTIKDALAVITFYCKCRAVKYQRNNGFLQILKPILELCLSRGDLYNCFYAMMSRYVPRSDLSPYVTNVPFNLLRLLLLYHDPDLCNFLDTCKISFEMFCKDWFKTLFASCCSSEVVSAIWDIYLQKSDPFFVLYLALVILVNAKEQVMTSNEEKPDVSQVVTSLSMAPSVLTVDDVTDFCQLAAYYSDRTPSSFRRELGGCFYSGTIVSSASRVDNVANELSQAFCLKVSIPELLLSSQPSHSSALDDIDGPQIRYFLVDCRPAQEYNKGHLLTAFHLDATLMLKEPLEFSAALTSLFAAQEQAIQAGSAAGGEHLCFLGSGLEEDDQYMFMVIANLLQKHKTFVSLASGGYKMLIEYLSDVGIDLSEWIVGAEREKTQTNSGASPSGNSPESKTVGMKNLMKKMAGNLLENSVKIKEKVANFIENVDEEWNQPEERHIQSSVKGKPYRGTQSVFSIGDEENDQEDDDHDDQGQVSRQEIEDLKTWTSKPDLKFCFECQSVNKEGTLLPGYLFVTHEEMYCLLVVKSRKERRQASKQIWVRAQPPRSLRAIVKITSRRSFPELITFKFGDLSTNLNEPEPPVIAADRYVLPEAGTATKEIKYLIIEAERRFKSEQNDEDSDAEVEAKEIT